jgi:hypothetical protein
MFTMACSFCGQAPGRPLSELGDLRFWFPRRLTPMDQIYACTRCTGAYYEARERARAIQQQPAGVVPAESE